MPFKDPERAREFDRQRARRRWADPNYRAKTKRRKQRYRIICKRCKKVTMGRKGGQFCTRTCAMKWLWDNGLENRFVPVKPSKYVSVRKNGKIVRLHRWLMEQHLGRKLERWEEVHHINGNKADNRLCNLQVVVKGKHRKMHMSRPRATD